MRHELELQTETKIKAMINSAHSLPVADNLLAQDFTATAPNQAWLTDITSIAWLYLAGHKDMYL